MSSQGTDRRGGPARALSAALIEAAKPDPTRQYELRDGRVPALALRVSQSGSKTWSLRYRTADGDQRRLSLGRYPSVGLAKARELALQALGGVAGGDDPAKTKRIAKAAARDRIPTMIAPLIEAYFAAAEIGRHRPHSRPKRASTLASERDYFDRLIKPQLGGLAVADLTRHVLQSFLDEVHATTPAGARWCHALIRQAFNFGIRRELISIRNPAQFAEVSRQTTRERVLAEDELRAIWRGAGKPLTVEGLSLGPGTGLAIHLAMVTLQRGGEVCGIHGSELDRQARLWVLPGERTKNHRPHVVPLSDAAVQILDQAFLLASAPGTWKGFAFPSPRGRLPIQRHALSRAVAKLTAALGIRDATTHDFRRTGSTIITGERIGIPRFIVSRVLNQITDTGGAAAVTAVYDRNEYLGEKRRALDAWATLLDEIVADSKEPQTSLP